jgi:dTDP-4-dehydrorhamnose reductase
MSHKTSILLTGGSGLLAVNWFYSKNNEYRVILGLNEREIHPDNSEVLFLDFFSEERLLKQIDSLNPSIVIHTAGLTSVEKCENNPDLAFHINVELSTMVANVTKRLDIRLVHISTDHLFEGNVSMLSEGEPRQAVNVYGRTKAMAESRIEEINPEALIIRTNFYAWGTSYRKSFSDFIIESLRNKKPLNLFDDVYYTPILAENLINTVHELLKKNEKGIFNIVSDDRISKYDFGILIAEEFGLDKSYIERCSLHSKSNLVKRPYDMSLSNQKVKELLGKNLGTVKQHIAKLHEQEFETKTQKIQLL